MSNPENKDEKAGANAPAPIAAQAPGDDYGIGYGRPPQEYQFKKGQSGNPRGRPRKAKSKKQILEGALNEPVTIRVGAKERKITKQEALIQVQLNNGLNGDTRSAKFVLQLAEDAGVGIGVEAGAGRDLVRSNGQLSQSDLVFQNVDPDRLSDQDKIDLARCATIIDFGGITALSFEDFKRTKEITNKGRGKDATPQG